MTNRLNRLIQAHLEAEKSPKYQNTIPTDETSAILSKIKQMGRLLNDVIDQDSLGSIFDKILVRLLEVWLKPYRQVTAKDEQSSKR